MIENITAVSVLWNEAERVPALYNLLTDYFVHLVVVVQQSTDNTLALVRAHPSITVIEDEHRGAGDYSMPLALSHVRTPWTFVVSGDEMPSTQLLDSLPQAVEQMERDGNTGAFIECRETIEGIEYREHGRHVRLFRTEGGWEARLHSAAPHENTILWPIGHLQHDRSLNEVMEDYLRYLDIAERDGDQGLVDVNRSMLYRSCKQTAAAYGWRHVRNQRAWPEVNRRIFSQLPSSIQVV